MLGLLNMKDGIKATFLKNSHFRLNCSEEKDMFYFLIFVSESVVKKTVVPHFHTIKQSWFLNVFIYRTMRQLHKALLPPGLAHHPFKCSSTIYW